MIFIQHGELENLFHRQHVKSCGLLFTQNQRTKCQETFKLFDKDGNGSISYNELGKAMEKLDMQPTEDELKEIFQW